MTDKNIDGIVTWLKSWFYDKTDMDSALGGKVDNNDLRLSDNRNPINTNIPNNTTSKDLNNFTTMGFYYCNSNDYAQYISHCPISNKAFHLLVESFNNGQYVKQTWTQRDEYRTFIRVLNANATWSSWAEIFPYNAIQTSFASTTSNRKAPSEKLVKDSLDGKQATLVSGTNIKTINNQSILGDGNISVGNEITNYRNYLIVPSNYNPYIDDEIDVTITVTDVSGNPVANEEFTMVYKIGNQSAITVVAETNSSGIRTFSDIPMNDWGIADFRIGDRHCQINVDGWRGVSGSSNGTFQVVRNRTHARLILRGWQSTSSASTSWVNFGGTTAYAGTCRPEGYVTAMSSEAKVWFRINTNGTIQFKSISGTVASTTLYYLDTEWAIIKSDL